MTGYITLDNLNPEVLNMLMTGFQNATVLTINGKAPDENGNIKFEGIESSEWEDFEL